MLVSTIVASKTGTDHLAATAPVSRPDNGGTEHGPLALNVPRLPQDMDESLPEVGIETPSEGGLLQTLMCSLWTIHYWHRRSGSVQEAILPDHTPLVLTVAANLSIEVTQQEEGIPRRGTLQYSKDSKKGGYAELMFGP